MLLLKIPPFRTCLFAGLSGLFICLSPSLCAQLITGTWQGRINRQKVEVKLIRNGDSLTGTSYYYESPGHYRRYSIRGYVDNNTQETIWWDDRLLEEKTGRFSLKTPGKLPLLAQADFNCPGGTRMMLDGTAREKDGKRPAGEVHLDKVEKPVFPDEWDWIIENYTVGGNDPELIDSLSRMAGTRPLPIPPSPGPETRQPAPPAAPAAPIASIPAPPPPLPPVVAALPPKSIREKFEERPRTLVREIPLEGDSIELRFYDNAEIDGDSISLFLNGQLLKEHIRLSAQPWVLRLAVAGLPDRSELTMVAENLGAIPPNTAYMIMLMGEKRQEALLASSEGSSAMIRFLKNP